MIGRELEHGTAPPDGYRWARLTPSHLVHLADARATGVSLCDVPVASAGHDLPASGGELCERCRRECPSLRWRR